MTSPKSNTLPRRKKRTISARSNSHYLIDKVFLEIYNDLS